MKRPGVWQTVGVAGGVVGLMTQSSGWALSWWPLEGVIETVSSLFTAW